MEDLYFIEDLEEHPAHLMLNQLKASIYTDLLEKEIKKWKGVLTRTENFRYESIVMKDIKKDEINKRLSVLKDMLDEMNEQTAW